MKKSSKKTKKLKRIIAVLGTLLFLWSGFLITFFVISYQKSHRVLSETIDMADEVVAKAYVWLSEIEGNSLTYEETKEIFGEISLECTLTPKKRKNLYDRTLVEGSYESCASLATVGFEKAYKTVVQNRLILEGFEGEVTETLVEELMMSSYQISVSDYLKNYGPILMPSKEEVVTKYEGEVLHE